jgi:hypothetical protein
MKAVKIAKHCYFNRKTILYNLYYEALLTKEKEMSTRSNLLAIACMAVIAMFSPTVSAHATGTQTVVNYSAQVVVTR